MNQLFHIRVTRYQYFLLISVSILVFCSLWYKYILLGVLCALFLIALIEYVINSYYAVTTDKQLVIHRGRFLHHTEIPLTTITNIKTLNSPFKHAVYIEYNEGKNITLYPKDEEKMVTRIRQEINKQK